MEHLHANMYCCRVFEGGKNQEKYSRDVLLTGCGVLEGGDDAPNANCVNANVKNKFSSPGRRNRAK